MVSRSVDGAPRLRGAAVIGISGLLLAGCLATSPGSPSAEASPSTVESALALTSPTGDPVVAAGEEWIVYQWMAGNGDGIFLVRPDGTGGHQLVPDLEGSEIHPDWSPDGSQIAFVHVTPADRSELLVVDAEGTDATMLFSCDLPCNTVSYPDWAPDGTAIYYAMDANASDGPPITFEVGLFDLGSGEASVVLTREDGMTVEQPRISPPGTQVVYTRFRDPIDSNAGTAIFVADLEGGSERQVTDWELFAAHPDWATNDRIVFNTYDLGAFQDTTEPANLYTVGIDGTDLEQLTTFGDHDTRATQPRWTPDGSGIVFTQVDGEGFGARRLAYVGADGTGMRFLTPEPIDGTHPQLRPVLVE